MAGGTSGSTRSAHPGLRGLVADVVDYRIDGAPAGVHIGMPSRSLTLILALDEGLDVSWPAAPGRAPIGPARYRTLVGGLHVEPAHIHHQGSQRGIQLALTPQGARSLLGLPAAELPARGLVELADLVGRSADLLAERLAGLPDRAARLEVLQSWLVRRLGEVSRWHTPAAEVSHAWRELSRSHGQARVRDLAAAVGWSARHLGERFRREYGIPPKVAARLMRFERSHRMMRPGARIADIAAACGYADQAHLVREWRAFAGMAPTVWLREDELAFVQAVA